MPGAPATGEHEPGTERRPAVDRLDALHRMNLDKILVDFAFTG